VDDEQPAVMAATERVVRYCRARPLRHRGATRPARLTVHHVGGSGRAMTLAVRRRQPTIVASTLSRYRGLVLTTVALLVFVSGLAGSIVAGQRRAPVACPAHSPIKLTADGHWLGIRTDPPVTGTMLVHLCVGGAADPVTRWTLSTDRTSGGTTDSGRATDAVLAVAKQEALAALAATTDIGRMSVTVETSSGKLLRFGQLAPAP
jgi:hypothetical protein